MEKMNVKQVADYLGLSVQTIYNYRSMGVLPYHRLNGKGRPVFFKAELDRLYGNAVEDRSDEILNDNARRKTS